MKKNNFIFFIIKIFVLFLFIFLINYFIFGFYIVNSINYKSINIYPHDFLIYYKLEKNYNNNDIVFYNNKIYRVIGTYGQVINKKGNKILIDNEIIDGEIKYEYKYPYIIKKHELFLKSDIDDSKLFGCISSNKIDGKLIFRIQIRDF